jgi:lipooligosaccharide transport system permease protein
MSTATLDTLWAIRCVWLRYFDVFRKSILYYFVTTLIEPILSLLSFGFGVGRLVGNLHVHGMDLTYRKFIFAGVVGQTILFQGFFESAYGGYVRMYYQRIFTSMGTTPITLSEVLWGELLWNACKGSVAASFVVMIGSMIGDFPPYAVFAAFPVCFVSTLMFAGLGLLVAATAKSIEQISYPQYLFVFPMFLFCGVFFPLQTLPHPIQMVAWVLPLTSVLSILRTITLGFPFEWWAIPPILFWGILLILLSRRAMIRRLVK